MARACGPRDVAELDNFPLQVLQDLFEAKPSCKERFAARLRAGFYSYSDYGGYDAVSEGMALLLRAGEMIFGTKSPHYHAGASDVDPAAQQALRELSQARYSGKSCVHTDIIDKLTPQHRKTVR
eukprot:6999617-Alexandrium_andersonii.AAC.1